MSEQRDIPEAAENRQIYWDLVEAGISRLLKQKERPAARLTPETDIVSLDLDSLDMAEMLVGFELSLEIEISASDMTGVITLADFVGLLRRLKASTNV